MLPFLITAASSYLLGSIPFGYLLVRLFRGQDIRQTGSGNIGATNVSRTSPILGVITLLLDGLKGYVAVRVAVVIFNKTTLGSDDARLYLMMAVAALFAIVGHMFPVWLKFRGGKGVATGLGSFVLLAPTTVLVMICIFVAAFVVFRYVSLASIITVALFPLLAWILEPRRNSPQTLVFMTVAALLIIFKHHENIRRLLAHTERRYRWGGQ